MSTPNILIDRMVKYATKDLNYYFKNARKGDMSVVVESMKKGQYKPIVVNLGTLTGRKNEVLAGNHTLKAARQLNWDQLAVVFVDVDDEEAARINLVDNRSNDLAVYDNKLMAEIMEAMDNPTVGTGYRQSDVDLILDAYNKPGEDIDLSGALFGKDRDFDDVPLGEEGANAAAPDDLTKDEKAAGGPSEALGDAEAGELDPDDIEQPEGPTIEGADDFLKGARQLDDSMVFPSDANFFGIPELLKNMLVTPDMIPDNLTAWAGSATKDWPDADQWWLYNWGTDSTSGMNDVSKVIIGFYSEDHYFENWWDYPSRYLTKVINSGITMMLTPDFSPYSTSPRVINLYQKYRNMWLGRFFQEAGLKVIPSINHIDDPDFWSKYSLLGIPVNTPVISIQQQAPLTDDKPGSKEWLEWHKHVYTDIQERLKPELCLVYASQNGWEMVEGLGLKMPLKWVPARLIALRNQAASRQKKTTI